MSAGGLEGLLAITPQDLPTASPMVATAAMFAASSAISADRLPTARSQVGTDVDGCASRKSSNFLSGSIFWPELHRPISVIGRQGLSVGFERQGVATGPGLMVAKSSNARTPGPEPDAHPTITTLAGSRDAADRPQATDDDQDPTKQ